MTLVRIGLEPAGITGILARMSRAFVSEPGASTLVRATEESARNTAEVYRAIEPDFDFEVRQGRNGWMIARLRKDGTFESWVEE